MAKITIKEEWIEGIATLPSSVKAEVMGAMTLYLLNGETVELSKQAAFAFNLLLPSLANFADKSSKMRANGQQKKSICSRFAEANEQQMSIEEDASPFSPSPTPPATQSTPEEEKETLSKESTKKKPQTLEERKIAFGMSLEQYTGDGPGQFPREMVTAFYRYWTEASPGGVKMLWEKQKTFDPKLRLENWKRREEEREEEKRQRQNNTNYGTGHKQTNHRLETDFSGYEYESTI